MSVTNEQAREYIAQLEPLSNAQIRSDLEHDKIPSAMVYPVTRWLSGREMLSESKQIDIARRASEAAQLASVAAERAATAAERQATAAERANTKANIALAIAIISPIVIAIVTVIGIMISHWDTRNEQSSISPQAHTEGKTH